MDIDSDAGAPAAGTDPCIENLLAKIRACTACAAHLPLGPRPVVRASPTARVLIVGQAPGTRVHDTGIPWNDPSGDRLRAWMGVDRATFYDERRFAIVPMGFCYPGRAASGDMPPRPECAPLWHGRLLARMPELRLVLLAGSYAHRWYLGGHRKGSLTETVRAFRSMPERFVPLPHPSGRNNGWFKRHPWFDEELVPELRRKLASALPELASAREPRPDGS
ncbi:uracil-DNA glycosylase family protein [Marinimicrococcus flavescens]|uniref:Uracil-DNA glycosylase family protein n=1 Tax=Marinimicrococcus flavescens TaxID=3031815 RepID=A0AAP3XRB9_9PROT|nr:uracil-DNA glycosylase family protein [Marinimicrococcus flavescens]